MKVSLIALLILINVSCYSQDTTKVNKADSLKSLSEEGADFYVMQSGDLRLIVDTEELSKEMELLDPSWIESITVYKAADAKLKFGEKATDGVIIVDITKAGFSKLPKSLRGKFKKVKTDS